MQQYIYAYNAIFSEDEVLFRFPKFPEIITAIRRDEYSVKKTSEIQQHVSDAVVTAIQLRISARMDVPDGDNLEMTKADGFVVLSVQQAMKLEFYKIFKFNCKSLADCAVIIKRKETAVRRLLDLRHASVVTEIEDAVGSFGKRLAHSWAIEGLPSAGSFARPKRSSVRR